MIRLLFILLIKKQPEFITKINNEVPVKLEKILEKTLAKNPEKRFQTLEEIIQELNNINQELKEGRSKKLYFQTRKKAA